MPIQSSMGSAKLDVRYGDRSTIPYFNGTLLSTAEVSSCRAGRVYSLTTGGFLVPGILAAASASGGQIPFFGLSGLDANNYPDVQRDRGMPGYSDLGFTATATAAATATINGGATGNWATGLTIAYPGWYPAGVAPTVTITPIGGSGAATGTAVLTLGRVTGITLATNTVAGATGATIVFSAPSYIGNEWSSPKLNGPAVQAGLTGMFATIRHNMAGELSTTEFDTTASYPVGAALTALSATGAAAGLKGRIKPATGNNLIIGHVAPAGVYVGPEGYSTLAFSPAFVVPGSVDVPNS
jgi:hypothetical protein